jgi:hypothetical protein
MNTNDVQRRSSIHGLAGLSRRTPAHGRWSLLVVVGIALANVGAVLTVASAPDYLPLMALGVAVFIAGAAIGLGFSSTLPDAVPAVAGLSGRATNQYGAFASAQFGSDPEQVAGRQTGART